MGQLLRKYFGSEIVLYLGFILKILAQIEWQRTEIFSINYIKF